MLEGLRNCDLWTFEAVRFAWLSAINSAPDRVAYWDIDPPDLEAHVLLALDDERHPLLGGLDNLRRAVAIAHERLELSPDQDGRPNKDFQLPLARQCVQLWRKYGPADMPNFSRQGDHGVRSPGVEFAAIIFSAGNMSLGDSRLVALLNGVANSAR